MLGENAFPRNLPQLRKNLDRSPYQHQQRRGAGRGAGVQAARAGPQRWVTCIHDSSSWIRLGCIRAPYLLAYLAGNLSSTKKNIRMIHGQRIGEQATDVVQGSEKEGRGSRQGMFFTIS
jgi:hypothetical protein